MPTSLIGLVGMVATLLALTEVDTEYRTRFYFYNHWKRRKTNYKSDYHYNQKFFSNTMRSRITRGAQPTM